MSELSEARALVEERNKRPVYSRKRNGTKRAKSYEELHGRLDTSNYEAEYGAAESEDNSIFGGLKRQVWRYLGNAITQQNCGSFIGLDPFENGFSIAVISHGLKALTKMTSAGTIPDGFSFSGSATSI